VGIVRYLLPEVSEPVWFLRNAGKSTVVYIF